MIISIDIAKIIDTVYALSAMRRVVGGAEVPAVFTRDNRAGLHRLLCDAFVAVVAQLPLRRVLDFGPDIYATDSGDDDAEPGALPDQLWLEYDVSEVGHGYATALAEAVRLHAEALVYGQTAPAHADDCRQQSLRHLAVFNPPQRPGRIASAT